jgi:hypothetical protein
MALHCWCGMYRSPRDRYQVQQLPIEVKFASIMGPNETQLELKSKLTALK